MFATVFTHLQLLRAGGPDEDFEDKHEDAMNESVFYLYAHPDFSDHAEGVVDGYYRVKRPSGDLDIDLPDEYLNHWRSELCRLCTGEPIEAIWRKLVVAPAFMALLDFPADEGFIGRARCDALAKDFAQWHERAQAHSAALAVDDEELASTWLQVYEAFAQAFQAASPQGVVQFQ